MAGVPAGQYQLKTESTHRVYIERIEHSALVKDIAGGDKEIVRHFEEQRETVLVLPCLESHIARIVALVTAAEIVVATKERKR